MKSIRFFLALATIVVSIMLAASQNYAAAYLTLFIGGAGLSSYSQHSGARLCVTLTSAEILADVIKAFAQWFPGLNRLGIEFRPNSLKLNQTYTAHIPTIPTVDAISTTYATTGNAARSLLVDVPITVDRHKAVQLYWSHFDAIKDQKNKYDEVIGLTGYALAKAYIDDLLSAVNTANFSQQLVYATADCDVDMLIAACGAGNTQKMLPIGRTLFVNTDVANTLSADQRLINNQWAGQIVTGTSMRRWTNTQGFAEIIEYPDMPSNNGTALNSVTGTASTDLMGKTAHGLATGDPVIVTFSSGFGALTSGTKYWVIKVDADTFKLATTLANAAAGTAINISSDGTGATVTPSESLVAFSFDQRAIATLAGIPDNFDQDFLTGLNIPRTMGFETLTESTTGISMAAVSWQEYGTGKLVWAPTMVWGKALGRQSYSNAVGAKCDYAGLRIASA
jgi:hypothetical protein